ncbi:transposase [Streptomyces caniferus]|uniref:transposase n=1 Tax=Streptomyces caniferus TaxID=285557 RepID=UPI0039A51EC9
MSPQSGADAQWAGIEPLLPDRRPKRGGRWRNHRDVFDGTAWKFQTGSQWVTCRRWTELARGPPPTADVGRRRHMETGVHRADGPGR